VSGIVFVALFVAGSILFDQTPSIGDSDEAIVAYYESSASQVRLQAAYLVLTLAAVFFVWYVGTLSARLRAAEGGPGWLSRIVLVSGAAFVTAVILGFLVGGMVADIGDDTDAFQVDPHTARLLSDASYTFVFETALPLAAPMVLAVSIVDLRGALVPRWVPWAGLVVAVLCLLGFLGVPMGLFLAWVVLQAVYSIRRPGPVPAAEPMS
jgi:hypothetical protein